MPTEFRYLIQKDRGSKHPSVEDHYKIEDLATRPVIRDEYRNRYFVFESRDEFLEWYDRVPEAERCCHEVIFGRLAQRIHFDIDAPSHKLDALPDSTLEASLRQFGEEDLPCCNSLVEYEICNRGSHGGEKPCGDIDNDHDFEDQLAVLLGVDSPVDLLAAAPAPLLQNADHAHAATECLRAAKIRTIVNVLIEAILDELYVAYYGVADLLPTREDLVVTDSSGPETNDPAGIKYSFHILVLPYSVADNEEAREFTSRVLERLPAPLRGFIDPDVNKRTQNFRLAGSAKPGTGRYKHATREAAQAFGTAANVPLGDLFVAAPSGGRVLPRVYTEAGAPRSCSTKASLGPQSAAVIAALDLAARSGATAGHSFSEVRGTLLCFVRDAPSHCHICGETHHNDNSLLVGIDPVRRFRRTLAGGDDDPAPVFYESAAVACRIVEHCRQARGRSRTLGTVTLRAGDLPRGALVGRQARGLSGADPDEAGGDPDEAGADPGADPGAAPRSADLPPPQRHDRIAERVAAIREGRVNPHDALASAFERLPEGQKTVYAAAAMRPYELTPTLAVLAQMKLGKTKAMRAYLAEHFPAGGLEERVIRFVTFRQTFSSSIAKSFPDFTLYNSVTGDLDQARYPRLIIQVESLHRLTMRARPEPIDLLVLDEAESILAQFSSGLHKHFNAAFAMFQWMVQTARHVVCMDANLSDRTFRTLERLRPAHPLHFHWNRFARAADDAYYFTTDQGAWLGHLYAALRGGARVVLPTNSLTEARAYEDAIRREFPRASVMLYSSETPPSEKTRHFGDVHSHWGCLDVLIYTPTCSAGVSFELEHYDVLFGFFCDASCDVETCRQMLGRVRNLRTREHYICLRAVGAALPTETESIGRYIRNKRAGLYRDIEGPVLQFEYGADGEIRFYETNFYHLWVETVRVTNLSRNDFARRFIDQVADTGARVTALAPTAEEVPAGAALLAAHREARTGLKGVRCAAVAAAADLSPDEAARAREAFQGQQDVEPGLRLAYEKYLLREAYAWHGRPLDAGFVAAYQSFAVRRVYRGLCRITEGTTVLDSLRRMRRQEADHYDYVMESRGGALGYTNENRDLVRDRTAYVYQAHFIAIWLLQICGFSFAGKEHVREELLEYALRGAIPALKRAGDGIVFEFEIPRPNLDLLGREPDRAHFLAGMLRFINAVLRAMYGLQVKRGAKRAAYFSLGQTAVGKLFVFAQEAEPDNTPGGPRPHIPSNLLEAAPTENQEVIDFIEDVYYAPDGPGWVNVGGENAAGEDFVDAAHRAEDFVVDAAEDAAEEDFEDFLTSIGLD